MTPTMVKLFSSLCFPTEVEEIVVTEWPSASPLGKKRFEKVLLTRTTLGADRVSASVTELQGPFSEIGMSANHVAAAENGDAERVAEVGADMGRAHAFRKRPLGLHAVDGPNAIPAPAGT